MEFLKLKKLLENFLNNLNIVIDKSTFDNLIKVSEELVVSDLNKGSIASQIHKQVSCIVDFILASININSNGKVAEFTNLIGK